MRLQNLPYVDASTSSCSEFPLDNVSTLFFPELEHKESKSRIGSPEVKSKINQIKINQLVSFRYQLSLFLMTAFQRLQWVKLSL